MLTTSAHNEFTIQWFGHYFDLGGNCGSFFKEKREQFQEDQSGYGVWKYLERSEVEGRGT